MRTLDLGEAVGPGVPTGGTANQVLVKNGSTNFDTSWKEASQLPAISDEAAAREAADAALADGLAIVANGNTHAAITSGQYVYVKNHSSLAEGLYKATAAIGTNAALSTSNLTADSQGGLNALKASVDTLNSKLTYTKASVVASGISGASTEGYVIKDLSTNTVRLYAFVRSLSTAITTTTNIATIPEGYRPSSNMFGIGMFVFAAGDQTPYYVAIRTDGNIRQNLSSNVQSVLMFAEYPL